MKIFYLLIEVVAIQVYVFVQTDQIVYIKCVFILCKVHSSDTDINKWDSDQCKELKESYNRKQKCGRVIQMTVLWSGKGLS